MDTELNAAKAPIAGKPAPTQARAGEVAAGWLLLLHRGAGLAGRGARDLVGQSAPVPPRSCCGSKAPGVLAPAEN